ncbi:hypothetical protein Moror_4845 [Moniliophthora roreri MCA 2997]|uniref:Uncharacterized protein n=1 Tax=Moniliophthora roreri (strain MCA 2997) TaxID=1381753 RepID=V2WTJ9_MONRO|nr:hypothetical protein Moror_4845 [Moniliophthora roreri MCA 2997]
MSLNLRAISWASFPSPIQAPPTKNTSNVTYVLQSWTNYQLWNQGRQGHYTSLIRRNGNWILHDDEKVKDGAEVIGLAKSMSIQLEEIRKSMEEEGVSWRIEKDEWEFEHNVPQPMFLVYRRLDSTDYKDEDIAALGLGKDLIYIKRHKDEEDQHQHVHNMDIDMDRDSTSTRINASATVMKPLSSPSMASHYISNAKGSSLHKAKHAIQYSL